MQIAWTCGLRQFCSTRTKCFEFVIVSLSVDHYYAATDYLRPRKMDKEIS